METAVVVALIGLLGAVITAIVGPLVIDWAKRRRDRKTGLSNREARQQTESSIDEDSRDTSRSGTRSHAPAPSPVPVPSPSQAQHPLPTKPRSDVPTPETVQANTAKQSEEDYADYLGVDKLPVGEPRAFLPETPDEVLETFKGLPPLSRSAFVAEAYRGRWMRSSGVVVTVTEGDGCYTVGAKVGEHKFIVLTFPPSTRAIVETFREGEHIRFEGQLRTMDDFTIELVRPSIIERSRA
jgi:hypothetical protein